MDDEFKDVFPDKICMRCSKALNNAADIRALCLNSDKLLRQELQTVPVIKDEGDFVQQHIEVHLLNESSESKDDTYEEPEEYQIEEALEESFSHYEGTEDNEKNRVLQIETIENTNEYLNDGYGGQFKVCEICGKIYTKNYIANHRKTHELEADKVKYHCRFGFWAQLQM